MNGGKKMIKVVAFWIVMAAVMLFWNWCAHKDDEF
jgi:hypothetical protein